MDFDAPSHVDRYAAAFHAPVTFGTDHTCIASPRTGMLSRAPIANAATHRRAAERLEATERNFRAVELTSDASLDLCQIFAPPGYSEPSNFSRAFRRWLNQSPLDYRKSSATEEGSSQSGEA